MERRTQFEPTTEAVPQRKPSAQAPRAGRGWWVALAALSLLGIAAGLYMNRWGVDVEPDSAVFLASGMRLAHGEGISDPNMLGAPVPMAWFPPAIPWLVSVIDSHGRDIRYAFGILNALCWGGLIAWTGWLARRASGGNSVMGLVAAGTILTSSALATVYGFLYSEPPFLLFALGSIATLAVWWERPTYRLAAIAGACVGAALLTRYVGITLVLLGGLVTVARPGRAWGSRILSASLFSALAFGPLFGWRTWEKIVRHSPSERTLGWHPLTMTQINEGVYTLASFILPVDFVGSNGVNCLVVAMAAGVAGLALFLWLRRGGGSVSQKLLGIPPLVGISAAFIVVYLSFLVVSISIADADTPLDWRILSIILPPGLIVAAFLANAAFWETGGRLPRSGLILIGCLFLVLQGRYTFNCNICRGEITWPPGSTSPVLEALQALPTDSLVYSNDAYAIYMVKRRLTENLPDRLPQDLPEAPKPPNARSTELHHRQLEQMKTALAPKGGWVIYWKKLDFKDPVISEAEVKAAVPVAEERSFEDGVLLRIAPRRALPRN